MNYRLIYTAAGLRGYLAFANLAAFDFETAPDDGCRDEPRAALDAHRAHIAGVSLSVAEGSAVYIPLAHRNGRNAEAGVWDALREFFADEHVVKIAHNLAFEAMFLYSLGIVIAPPFYDTIAAVQLTLKECWEFRSLADSGLKTLAFGLFGADLPDFGTVTGGRHFDELDPAGEETLHYACADSDYTLRLYHRVNQWFLNNIRAHRHIAEAVESPAAVYTGIMKYNGVPADKEAMLVKQAEAGIKIEALRAGIGAITGGVDIGANAATAAFKRYLYDELGLPVLKTTEKQREAADEETMILLGDYCRLHRPHLARLFEAVLEYRKWGKLKSTYIDGYLSKINPVTGRIHPDLMPLGTETGRFASRNPNMQNCPRKGSDPVGVRGFIAAPAGKMLLSLDFSQIELRVGAYYCRDRRMMDVYRDGGDIHAATAAVIYKIPLKTAADKTDPRWAQRRAIAKNCNFGVFFGLYPAGLYKTLRFKAGLDVTQAECAAIIDNLKTGYPGLTEWQNRVRANAADIPWTTTALGRRRYILGIRSVDYAKRAFAERCALNTPIQGTAADILKLAMGRILRGLAERPWLKPLLQIHDELVFEVPADRVREGAAFVKTCMEARPFDKFDLPIAAEAAYGPNFAELTGLEFDKADIKIKTD